MLKIYSEQDTLSLTYLHSDGMWDYLWITYMTFTGRYRKKCAHTAGVVKHHCPLWAEQQQPRQVPSFAFRLNACHSSDARNVFPFSIWRPSSQAWDKRSGDTETPTARSLCTAGSHSFFSAYLVFFLCVFIMEYTNANWSVSCFWLHLNLKQNIPFRPWKSL